MKLPRLAVCPAPGATPRVSDAGRPQAPGGIGRELALMLVGEVFLDLDPGSHPVVYAFQNGTGTCVQQPGSPLNGGGVYCTVNPPAGDTTNYDVTLERGVDYRIGTTSDTPAD